MVLPKRASYVEQPPRALLWRSTNQAIATGGGGAAVIWDTARYNVGGGWQATSNPSRWTCPLDGLYRFTSGGLFDAIAGGARRTADLKIGGALVIQHCERYPPAAGASFADWELGKPYELTAGQYVEVWAFQDSGGPVNVLSLNDYSPWFAVERVCPRAA